MRLENTRRECASGNCARGERVTSLLNNLQKIETDIMNTNFFEGLRKPKKYYEKDLLK